MPRLILDVSVSLDGFCAGPDVGVAAPMGAGGEALHHWMATDAAVAAQPFALCGAVITGRRTFDLGIGLWGDDGAFGMPCFVLTHRPRPPLVKGPTTFHFVGDGHREALRLAQVAAADKDVWLMGSAEVARQYLREGLVDEMRVHLVPLLLGSGARLFDGLDVGAVLHIVDVKPSATVTHITYRPVRH